jgi:acyl-CoA synthetase (AMP-forming)/AMP-acid ligase II/thioesterase domain-containing protein
MTAADDAITSLAGLVEARARRGPDAVVLRAPGREPLTARALHDLVGSFRTVLRERGVGPAGRVALVERNGPEAAAAFLAIAASAGCAPLNPASTRAELEFALADMRADAVALDAGSESPARALAAERGLPVIELGHEPDAPSGTFRVEGAGPSGRTPADLPSPDAVSLLLHTSGTTARPKLVPLTQRNLLASARNVAATLALAPGDVCLNAMPLFHIHGLVASLLASLRSGGSVVCAPGFDARRFADWGRESGATWTTAVPTIHQGLLARLEAEPGLLDGVELRFLRSSSAALPVPVLEALEDALRIPVVEAYGMTEAAHQMASNPLPPGRRLPGSVGPAAGPEVTVLDPAGNELERGQVGEVAIRGENVFAGYEASPAADAAGFVAGWFRTGDEGWLDDDGYLHLRGRLKELINRGGEKISPLEVDSVLLEHPAVANAVTFAVADARVGEEVAAAVVLAPERSATEREVQDFVVRRLAPFKVPRHVVFVDDIPRGPTGKVQRTTMASQLGLELQGAAVSATSTGFESQLESALARLWADALGLDVSEVRVDDDFFALGGDSLGGAALVARARDLLGRPDIPLISIVRSPTIAAFAAELLADEPPGEGALVRFGRETGSKLFFVHGLFGDVIGFAALAARLPDAIELVGIRAPELYGGAPGPADVASIAWDYLAAVREDQPHGPYLVGGFCMGGPVAIELARLLLADGERAGVVLLDPRMRPPRDLRSLGWTVRRRLGDGGLGAALHRRLRSPAGAGHRSPAWERLERARNAYRLKPLDAPAILIRAADFDGMGVPLDRWRRGLPRLAATPGLESTHGLLFYAPQVDEVAAVVGAAAAGLL